MGWGTWLPQYTLLRGLSESHQLFNNFQTTFVTKFYKCAHSKRFGGFANFCQHETWQYVSVKGPQSLNHIKPLNIIRCFPLFFCCKALKKSSWFLNWFLPLGASKKSWLFLSGRWEGNALLWAARWNYKSPWQPCNRWIINVIQLLYIWNKQSIADVTEWTFQRTRLKKCLKSNSSLIMFWSSSYIDHM